MGQPPLSGVAPEPAMPADMQPRSPYVGPRPFELADRWRFFGREREADTLLSLVIAHRVLLLYAQSGAGKTSLINARLHPLLDQEEFEVFPSARVQGLIPQTVRLDEITNVYAFNTLISLAKADADMRRLARQSLIDFLKERERSVDEAELPIPRVLIFDQFEELFTTYQDRWRDRFAFFAQLRDALDADPLLRVVLAMREEYIAQLDPYAGLLPQKLQTRFRLERLRERYALNAIKEPLQGVGRSFADGVAEKLVDDLLRVKVDTGRGETVEVTGEFVEPVQLQVVCQSLWQALPPDVTQITHTHLTLYAQVGQVLARFYTEAVRAAVAQSQADEEQLRSWCENVLITSVGTRGTVYRTQEKTGGIPNTAIDVLESMHLIRAEWRAGTRWYELSHDSLIRPIREANRLWRKPARASEAIPRPDTAPATLPQAMRDRSRMLEKIRSFWIKGVLEISQENGAALEMGMQLSPEAVARSWDLIIQPIDVSERKIVSSRTILDVFDDFGGTLLILGEPGSGKTTMLLELARGLIARAEQDPTHPIPVVFNLAAWSAEQLPLVQWLIKELNIRYDVPVKLATAWLAADQILPLFDGLDEVAPGRRTACVEAINRFRQDYSLVSMAICSRSSEYKELPPLKLGGAVLIQPLTAQQIDEYLARSGSELAPLRALFDEHAALAELARSPLMLGVITLAYREGGAGFLPVDASPEQWQRRIFGVYVTRVFQRRSVYAARYNKPQTIHWLAWLAQGMLRNGQAFFLIERLTPAWLTSRAQRSVYSIGVQLIALCMVLLAIFLARVPSPLVSLILGVTFVWSLQSSGLQQGQVKLVERLYLLERRGAIPFLVGLLMGALMSRGGLVEALLAGLSTALFLGVAYGVQAAELEVKSYPNEGIRLSARNAAVVGLLGGLAIGALWGIGFGWVNGVLLGLASAITLWFHFGGLACIQHLILRLILWRRGNISANYARFLDYAVECVFLRKVGGGYIFVHRLLQEYFATMERGDRDA